MNILIVEDSKDQRLMLSVILRKKGHQVLEAENGVVALEMLQSHPDVPIVISDWMMPAMDGIELCQAIRKTDLGRYVYFILLTGKTENEAVIEGMNLGADDFLNKPVDFDELEARLKAGIRIIELERALEQKNQALSKAIATIEKDLQSAARTQASLLAQPEKILQVDFNWYFKPSRILGGDMFGYHALDDERVYFYQLDVAGHGIPSALFSFTLNNILSESSSNALSEYQQNHTAGYQYHAPEQMLRSLNKRFQATPDNMHYFTIVHGVVNSAKGTVTIARAGHPMPLWLQQVAGVVAPISGSGGIPIGMMPDSDYQSVNVQLHPGDRLFLYTDGLTECTNAQGEQFGEQRLAYILKRSLNDSIETLIGKVEQAIDNWSGLDNFADDVSFLVWEWQPPLVVNTLSK